MTNLSGRHVFLGHMSRLVRWTAGTHEFVVLHHSGNRDLVDELGDAVEWIECPAVTRNWAGRTLWEQTRLPATVVDCDADGVVGFSGTDLGALPVPLMSFASNPWCLVPDVERSPSEDFKAGLQRKAYSDAVGRVETLVFASDFLRRAYEENARTEGAHLAVVHPGIDEEVFAAARADGTRPEQGEREELRILTVSAMAPHKRVETVIRALGRIRRRHAVAAELSLVGGWPDGGYERRIRELISKEGLEGAVEITGYVPTERLYEMYGRAKVFCLMSRCESFGIPSVEAQAFGTPVVSSDRCAIPEICGEGGVFLDPDDVKGVAAELARLLIDTDHWHDLSRKARANAERYHWDDCSGPLPSLLDRTLEGRPRG